MNGHKRAIREVSMELGVDERVVDEVMRQYFGTIRRVISSGNFFVLGIHNFGTFRPRKHTRKQIIAGVDMIGEMNKENEGKHYRLRSREDIIKNRGF